MFSWIRGSSLRSEVEEKSGFRAARRMRCLLCDIVPNIESMLEKAWDQVGGLSRFVCAPAKRVS